mgnify:FL=1|tara:strand:- start:91 stop:423 length:333 start_codon:yes stop_codon:yes gene_type:complete
MIAEALAQLTPNAEWVIDGDSYEGITWLSSDITKPTKSEVTAKITELEAGEPLRLLRRDRNQKLRMSDWTQGSDVPDAIKTPWATYRQKLRDLPANTSDPNNPTWPTEPS